MYIYIYIYIYIFLIQLVAIAQGRIKSHAFTSFRSFCVLLTSTEGCILSPFDIQTLKGDMNGKKGPSCDV